MKKTMLMLVLVAAVFLSGCGRAANLANGENYYCDDDSSLEVVQTTPELRVRFTCTDPDNPFEVFFGGPIDVDLLVKIRDKSQVGWGLGVILQDGQIVQLYEVFYTSVQTHWRAPEH